MKRNENGGNRLLITIIKLSERVFQTFSNNFAVVIMQSQSYVYLNTILCDRPHSTIVYNCLFKLKYLIFLFLKRSQMCDMSLFSFPFTLIPQNKIQ